LGEAYGKERRLIATALAHLRSRNGGDRGDRLDEFDAGARGQKYPAIARRWRRNWEQVIPIFAFPAAVRRIIYTTNAIESLRPDTLV
jgi:putative transposase